MAHSTKGTPSPLKGGSDRPEAHGFRICFTPLLGVLFTVPSRYWCTIGRLQYLALGCGHPCFPPDFACPAVLTFISQCIRRFGYGSLTLFGRLFQYRSPHAWSHCARSGERAKSPYNPWPAAAPASYAVPGLGSSRFARRYFGNPLFSSGYVRCFSSPGSLRPSSGSVTCHQVGLPHSDSLGSLVASTSPRHFAAWPRPSSAESAKASTMCSSLTMSVLVLLSVSLCYGARGDTSVSPRSQARTAHLHCQCARIHPSGGAAGIRTPDLRRARAALSRLSYGPLFTHPCLALLRGWARLDSNQGPRPYQGRALTT